MLIFCPPLGCFRFPSSLENPTINTLNNQQQQLFHYQEDFQDQFDEVNRNIAYTRRDVDDLRAVEDQRWSVQESFNEWMTGNFSSREDQWMRPAPQIQPPSQDLFHDHVYERERQTTLQRGRRRGRPSNN